ncbi:unnamed protein product [Adineta steineri]|uniref:Poly [ADP-ribose] polymerase n=2 Tax=Adineta steineri TaxID=433720 RepID=A0A814WAF1_9BILA|nr:unnamed protein product [Adineta steineri]CAF1466623.1 unnamed protein product [Adineta steineri]
MKRINCSTDTSLDDNASDNVSKRKCIEHNTNNRNSAIIAVNNDESHLTTSNFTDPELPLEDNWIINIDNDNILHRSTSVNDNTNDIIALESFVNEQFEQRMAFFKNNPNILSTTKSDNQMNNDSNLFTTGAFLDLETKIYGENWTIPLKREESLSACLLSATNLALLGIADEDECCKKFMEVLIPEAFRKLHCSHHINNWSHEVQLSIYEITILLIDLIAARLSYTPVPIQLLSTLAILFDSNSVFHQKHKNQSFQYCFSNEELDDRLLSCPSFLLITSSDTHGWLCQIINRFVEQKGIQNLAEQFENYQSFTALEYNALLAPFVNCINYIMKGKYRMLFGKDIDQIFNYIENLKEQDFHIESINNTFELLSTLQKLCSVVWPHCLKRIEYLHLNLILQMITQTNFNAKMNSMIQLAKLFENNTLIPHDVLTAYITENSILWKALEGNIAQIEYMKKVCVLIGFAAPHFLKEDFEKLWKMQHGQLSFIFAEIVKFNSEQLNHLIDCIDESWKTRTMPMHMESIVLLGEIGLKCEKQSTARILQVLWDATLTNGLSPSMLDCFLRSHYQILSEDRSEYDEFGRDYSAKCIELVQRKEVWHARSVKYLNEILRLDPTNNKNFIEILVNKYNVINVLIENLSNIQQDMWNKTEGSVMPDTLVDGHLTFQESTKNHLEILSSVLKRGNSSFLHKHTEELWDILITNERASTCDREFGFSWFVDCVENFNRQTQITLFNERISKLSPIYYCPKGNACYKLYSERCNELRNLVLNSSTSSMKPIINRDLNALVHIYQGDLIVEQSDVVVVCSLSTTLHESVLKIGGDLMKYSFETEYKNNPTAPIISIAASGQLAAKTVYFLPWKPNIDNIKCCESIRKFVSNAMEKAATENYKSIAFPAVGCGQYGCSISFVAWTLVDEVFRQLVKYPLSVSFVILPNRTDIYNEFQAQINLIQETSEIKSLSVAIGKGTVEVEIGDITTQKVDVIIGNSSSDILKKEIMNAAGNDVKIAYAKEYENNQKSLILSIPSGKLPCKQIFFIKWDPDRNEDVLQQSIVDFIWNIIQNVILYKFTSVAFPAIGCGQYRCPTNIVVKTMVKEIKHQLAMRSIPLTVKFVIQSKQQTIFNQFCNQILSSREEFGTSIDYQLPSTWEQSTGNKLRFVVPSNSAEYKSIIADFDQTMNRKYTAIIQLERIQNERWYAQYVAHSKEFRQRLNTDTEKCLYHGCSQQVADSIIKNCFNRSFAGKHGTVYGVGVYFSSYADYSHSFTDPDSNAERCMFMARVLIGNTTQGNSLIRSPPDGFDSTTNGRHIFVIYHDAQAFAEYLITYK